MKDIIKMMGPNTASYIQSDQLACPVFADIIWLTAIRLNAMEHAEDESCPQGRRGRGGISDNRFRRNSLMSIPTPTALCEQLGASPAEAAVIFFIPKFWPTTGSIITANIDMGKQTNAEGLSHKVFGGPPLLRMDMRKDIAILRDSTTFTQRRCREP